jgi:hypothetical protein
VEGGGCCCCCCCCFAAAAAAAAAAMVQLVPLRIASYVVLPTTYASVAAMTAPRSLQPAQL